MKSFYAIVAVTCILLAAVVVVLEAKPLDIYDEWSDDRLYDGMVDFLDTISSDPDDYNSSPRKPRVKAEERCRMPIRKGVCRALIPRWSYDPETKKCQEFKFGGCDGNANNFMTRKQCMETCEGL